MMGQDRDGDFRMRPGRVQADLAQRPLYGRGAKLVKRGVGATPRVGGGEERGLALSYRIWERTMSVFDFV